MKFFFSNKMDSCLGVEREVDKILTKFNSINDHAGRVLNDITNHVENLKQEFELCKYLLSNFAVTSFEKNISKSIHHLSYYIRANITFLYLFYASARHKDIISIECVSHEISLFTYHQFIGNVRSILLNFLFYV